MSVERCPHEDSGWPQYFRLHSDDAVVWLVTKRPTDRNQSHHLVSLAPGESIWEMASPVSVVAGGAVIHHLLSQAAWSKPSAVHCECQVSWAPRLVDVQTTAQAFHFPRQGFEAACRGRGPLGPGWSLRKTARSCLIFHNPSAKLPPFSNRPWLSGWVEVGHRRLWTKLPSWKFLAASCLPCFTRHSLLWIWIGGYVDIDTDVGTVYHWTVQGTVEHFWCTVATGVNDLHLLMVPHEARSFLFG